MADWSPERENNLRALIAEGLSGGAIGDRLGITRNAVLGKAMRLGLKVGLSPGTYQRSKARKAPPPPRNQKVSLAPVSRAKAAPSPVRKSPPAPPPAPKPPAPKRVAVAPTLPTSAPIPFIGRTALQCSAIVGDVRASPAMCCGAPVKWREDSKGKHGPSSWCAYHHAEYTTVARPAPAVPTPRATVRLSTAYR
jgi:GcrA cell cycle regulator